MKLERRTFRVELRAAAEADEPKPRTIAGYAAVFNQRSENLGGWYEIIAPGAFEGCLQNDVRCLINHDESCVLGRTWANTLRLAQDDTGLHFECDLPDTSCAEDLTESMSRGDIDQCSFAFTVAPNGANWGQDQDGTPVRTVTKCSRLYDVSVVTYPAYPSTSAELRSASEILAERLEQPSESQPAGQEAPPASSGAVDYDLLRRKLELAYYEKQ